MIDGGKSDVTLVRYEDEASTVDLSRAAAAATSPPLWLHLVDRSDASPTRRPDAKVKTPAPPRDLPGGDSAVKLYDEFAPLVSPRAFGVLDAGKLKELGLDAPKRKLEVTVKGDVRRYDIGQPANAPGGESFLRDTRDGRVYLMPRAMLSELQNGTHLVDRRLHTFDLPEFDRISDRLRRQAEGVPAGRPRIARHRRLRPAEDARQARPDGQELARHPVAHLSRRVRSGAARSRPAASRRSPSGSTTSTARPPSAGSRSRAPRPAAAMSDEAAPTAETYVRSEHTAGWAKLSSGGQLIADAQKLIAAP